MIVSRITTLERRLQEKIEECDDIQAQLRRQKDLVQQHQAAVVREKKKSSAATKPSQKLGAEEVLAVEEVRLTDTGLIGGSITAPGVVT